MEVSVIIPARNERENLWFTICSARSELEASGFSHEIIAVVDDYHCDIADLLHQEGAVKVVHGAFGSPQAARQAGAEASSGNLLVFADAHVLFAPGFFQQLRSDMQVFGADLMHTPNRFLGKKFCGTTVDWRGYLWGAETIRSHPQAPFKVAISGHGAFGIWRDSYFHAGGYWQALKGFGGEETQLNFKLWLSGMSCWMTPRTYHWHWTMPLARHSEEMFLERDYARNFLLIAAAYFGEKRARASHRAFVIQHWKFEDRFPGLLEEVLGDPEMLAERERIGGAQSVDDFRQRLSDHGVVN